ncbi:hypothetical protein Kpol_1064p49 [Vanderwaltozyma polyspora DSM 70294]|uniref:Rhodanese domain-containing protein n=1 Tax=Vanderwaltozyma polyspora (strain ATCC 22028 / DSM 70294 / BCRC 21397 / CBS 2163 / NBRC 10782 / NRRL Y-8283 / UCD 57-17) TaxID=436907 RepID=A7TMH3_VANPO|nr:uncharacterized protein Kpol_1064p49 [Vanderwaltozyma polyspora DSM 70294]EDO16567.1 hypothetical protein Kpol_1064p49 [Vanderwaltozyma polyspora DSM 70294]
MLPRILKTQFNFNARVSTRLLSSKTGPKIYNFKEIKQIVENPDQNTGRVLVDVRESNELSSYRLPNSINVPYNSFPNAFGFTRDQFQEQFKITKPEDGKELVFFCAKGIRASNAEKLARSFGYENTAVYPGSITDWLAKGGADVKPKKKNSKMFIDTC